MDKNMKLLVWGIGHMAESLFFPEGMEVDAVDSDIKKQGLTFREKVILAPWMIKKNDYDYILITSELYENDILQQIQDMGFEKQHIIPARFLGMHIHDWYEKSHLSLVTTDNFRIVKDWFQNNNNREIIVNIKGQWGKIMNLDIFPYGVFTYGADRAKGRIVDLGTSECYWEGEWAGVKSIQISLHSDSVVLKIAIEGNHSAYLGVDYQEGNLLKAVKKIHSAKLREGVIERFLYCDNQKYHEKDYSVMEEFFDLSNYTIIDIGANVGQSALSFLKLTRMDIIAVEPQPNMAEPLRIVSEIAGKGRMRIENKGVGEFCGEMAFYIPEFEKECAEEASFSKERALARVDFGLSSGSSDESGLVQITVPVTTIDELAKSVDNPVFFIKIDAESFEEKIIRGGRETIRKFHPLILLEFNNMQQQKEINDFMNTICKYHIGYWNFRKKVFERTNRLGSPDYFMIPDGFFIKTV